MVIDTSVKESGNDGALEMRQDVSEDEEIFKVDTYETKT